MMKNISITAFIHLVFTLAVLIIVAAFLLFLHYDRKNFQMQQENRYQLISNGFLSGLQFLPKKEQLQMLYDKYTVKPVQKDKKALRVLKEGEVIFFREQFDSRVRVFVYEDDYYIYIQERGYNLMLQDMKPKSYNIYIASILLFVFLATFITLYIMVLKKLWPLKRLQRKIVQFGRGDTTVKVGMDQKDEIGMIAQSFDRAIANIDSLIESKNLFMKNFMHELKTPIAKGKIAVELLEDSSDKQLLKNVFSRMDTIVKNIATLEKAKTSVIRKKKHRFGRIYDNTKRLFFTEAQFVEDIRDFEIYADEEMLMIVLKNLLENAQKHSVGGVRIEAANGQVRIYSKAPPLDKPLAHYIEAFVKESGSKGLGLGLYLCDTILQLHDTKLAYDHSNGWNCFYFTMKACS
ncbi:MAG: ArsS family sensor histidine kinase [Campylobacterota bacterium]